MSGISLTTHNWTPLEDDCLEELKSAYEAGYKEGYDFGKDMDDGSLFF